MSVKAPDRITTMSKTLDTLLTHLGPEGLSIELCRRGLSWVMGPTASEPCRMGRALWEFQEHVRGSSATKSSRKTYLSELAQFAEYVRSRGLEDEEVEQVMTAALFGDYLAQGVFKTTTRNKKTTLLRKLVRYCQNSKWLITEMPEILKTKTVDRPVPKALSKKAVTELLELSKSTKQANRFYCIVTTMLATGARIGEVASMKVGNIDFKARKAKVIGKNHPEGRTLFLGQEVTTLLADFIYFQYGSDPQADTTIKHLYVFSAKDGTTPPNIGSIQDTFRRVVGKMKMVTSEEKKHLTSHSLRHTFATTGMEQGIDLYTLQQLLGHRNITTTEIYLSVKDDRLIRTVEQTQADLKIGRR